MCQMKGSGCEMYYIVNFVIKSTHSNRQNCNLSGFKLLLVD